MNRTRDYLNFAVRFCGLGYIVLWPLSAADAEGRLFGASLLCGERVSAFMASLCNGPRPWQLSWPLHLTGALATLLVIARLLLRAMRHRRRAGAAESLNAAAIAARIPSLGPTPRQKPPMPVRQVKPRAQFGRRVPR